MTALPSIVAGLFIYATFILILGMGKSGFAAALAISVMMLPIMIRASDVVLRLVPSTLKEASLGLGANNWHTMWHVTLPTARSGLVTAIILATARGIGETSPVLLTSGFTAAFNSDPFHGPMVSLPLAIFQFVKSPEPTMIARGFGTAAVLMLLVVTLFVIARVIGGQTVAKKEKARDRRQAMLKDARFFFHVAGTQAVRVWGSARVTAVEGARAIKRNLDRSTPEPTKKRRVAVEPKPVNSAPRNKKGARTFEEYLNNYPQARPSTGSTPKTGDDKPARNTKPPTSGETR
jgi:ABC-type molybdate transport system permease subunit